MKPEDKLSLIITENQKRWFKLAYHITENEEDAKDAVGNAIVKAYLNKDKIKKNDSTEQWFYKIVMNEAYNILRERCKEVMINLEDCGSKEDDGLSLVSDRLYLKELILQLPDDYRRVICLRYYDDKAMDEIGRITGVNTATVRTRLRRAKELLREMIKKGDRDNEEI